MAVTRWEPVGTGRSVSVRAGGGSRLRAVCPSAAWVRVRRAWGACGRVVVARVCCDGEASCGAPMFVV